MTKTASASTLSGISGTTNSTNLYTYSWWDGAQQARIVHTPNTASSGTKHTSTFSYDFNGRLSFVNIQDGRPRNVTYVTDMAGQVMSRQEADNLSSADPGEHSFFFNGTRIGNVGNDRAAFTTYVEAVNARRVAPGTGPFAGGAVNPTFFGDFDGAYGAITPNSPGATGGTITARAGDTLAGLAQAVWGDAALWYLLAEANGLSGSATLQAGQVLSIPAKVGNVHNTASTFKPYDPNRAIGDVNPTEPKPPAPQKGGKCGTIGKILVVIVAVAVTAYLGPQIIAGLTNAWAGTGAVAVKASAVAAGNMAGVSAAAAFTGGAIAGAAGSLASQVFGVATGIQEKIDWKGVGISALSGGFNKALQVGRAASLFSRIGDATNKTFAAAAQGATANVLTQGVARATGLQQNFDWTGVAVAAVSSGTAHAVGGHVANWAKGLPFGQGGVADGARSLVADLGTGMAAATTGALTQSLITGDSFGDTLIATLPQTIGATLGNMIGGQLLAAAEAQAEARASRNMEFVDYLGASPVDLSTEALSAFRADMAGLINRSDPRAILARLHADLKLSAAPEPTRDWLLDTSHERRSSAPTLRTEDGREIPLTEVQIGLMLPANLSSGSDMAPYTPEGLRVDRINEFEAYTSWLNPGGQLQALTIWIEPQNQDAAYLDFHPLGPVAVARDGSAANMVPWYKFDQAYRNDEPLTYSERHGVNYVGRSDEQIAFREGPLAAAEQMTRPYGLAAMAAMLGPLFLAALPEGILTAVATRFFSYKTAEAIGMSAIVGGGASFTAPLLDGNDIHTSAQEAVKGAFTSVGGKISGIVFGGRLNLSFAISPCPA